MASDALMALLGGSGNMLGTRHRGSGDEMNGITADHSLDENFIGIAAR